MRVVLVASVHSLEPATVDRDHDLGEQVQPSAKHYELAAGCPDRWPVVLAEIGNGLEIRHEASGQPHQFDVALGLPLQAPARLDAVEIAEIPDFTAPFEKHGSATDERVQRVEDNLVDAIAAAITRGFRPSFLFCALLAALAVIPAVVFRKRLTPA